MAERGKKLLSSAAGKAARSYLEHLIYQADTAAERLHDPDDAEALHDFRVAIRRSRSWLKAFNDHIGIDDKELRRLRTLARRTNAARDAEIALMWLGRMGEGSEIAKLVDEFELRRAAAYAQSRELIEVEWPKFSRKLSTEAENCHDGPTFAGVVLEQATTAHSRLAASLEHIHSIADIEAAHRARIAAKRLRYLLEPFRDVAGQVDEAVELLKQVQDDFGDLHDLHLLLESLPSTTGAEALADRIEAEKQKLFKVIHKQYLGATENDFMGRLGDAIACLHVD